MRRNNKKRNFYTILLIIIAVLVVGYAALSSVLNLFGGLTVVGGNSFNVSWNNIVVNEDSTGIATTPPAITNNDNGISKQVNFEVNLSKPGDFYEFYVDAVNTGTIDAMIGSFDYEKLDANGDPVEADFLNCSVSYVDDIQLSSGQLLRSGDTITYKVRVEFITDISASELPSGETAFRFEYVVSYVQADDTAFVSGQSNLPEIADAVDYGYNITDGTYYRLNDRYAFLNGSAYEIGPVFTNQNSIPNTSGFDFALKHTISNGSVSSVGVVFRYNNNYSNITWTENCYSGTMKTSLNNIFPGKCYEDEYSFACEDEGLYIELSEDSSMSFSNGHYSCDISNNGESYCYN